MLMFDPSHEKEDQAVFLGDRSTVSIFYEVDADGHSVATGAHILSLEKSNGEYTLEIIPLLVNLA